MDVQSAVTQASTSQRNAATQGKQGGKELGKQDFLNLLMTQMANQDPMDPMNSEAMMQQMASLSTVEQLQHLNTKMDHMSTIQGDISRASSHALLGKDVEITSNHLRLQNNESAPVHFSLNGDAKKVVVQILNPEGMAIRSVDLGNQAQGKHTFTWDGKDNDGDTLPNGKYQFIIRAKSDTGEEIQADSYKYGKVSKIDFQGGRPILEVNNEWLAAEKVKRLSNRSEQMFATAQPLPIHQELPLKHLRTTVTETTTDSVQ